MILARSKNCILGLRIADCGLRIEERFEFQFPQSAIRNRLLGRIDADEFPAAPFFFELGDPGTHRKQRVVGAAPDIVARLELGAALANQNPAPKHRLPAETFYAQSLSIRIA